MADIELVTITVRLVLSDDNDEVIRLEYPEDASVAQMVGILTMSVDTILHPPGEEFRDTE